MFEHIDINVKLSENDIINNMKQHIAIKCEENQETISRWQGAVALWSSASTLDRKIEGSNLAANFSFERRTMTPEKRGDEFGNEDRTKARPQNERPSTRGTSTLETKKT